ncbi:MAG: Lrp/AsnC family transcriptional regulator [Candidatus Bathyarchaeota archaeon]|jgi:Lrp/AsnC family transcriptional regulator for asnA, asnC and gidA|nr:MAG: Lrp/AsnC family transcriptional regulator [Candidatus Bathyarchaeota archaeon]
MKAKDRQVAVDDLDLAILDILQENSRQTYSEIGRRLGLAHSTIYDRIRKMEQSGIIKKYTVLTDPMKTGLKSLTAILTVFTDPKETESIAMKLADEKEVLEVFTSLSEELLIIAKIVAEDQEKLHSFVAHSVAPLKGVMRIRTSIVSRKYKEQNHYFPMKV